MGALSHVLWFEDLRRGDVDVAGGKGANLGELIAAGIPAPPGFCVTTHAYRSFLDEAGITQELHTALDGIDVNDRATLDDAAARAQSLILDAAARPSCRGEINSAYERLGGGLVAVRSSATAEDTGEASFAGQQSTFLNIEGAETLLRAVRACWASLFERRAVYYRAQCGIDQMSVTIAVPVQRMVQSERSGVAFTVDPVTHAHDTIVIEAVRGLGEALVSGEVTPDMYAVDKATLSVIERTHVEQARELAYAGPASLSPRELERAPAEGSPGRASEALEANEWRELNAVKRRRPKLNDEEIARLAEIVKRVEAHYGAPQDIEWAEAGGEFYIVQSRPITTLAHAH